MERKDNKTVNVIKQTAWATVKDMGLINKVDMVCLSPVGYGV